MPKADSAPKYSSSISSVQTYDYSFEKSKQVLLGNLKIQSLLENGVNIDKENLINFASAAASYMAQRLGITIESIIDDFCTELVNLINQRQGFEFTTVNLIELMYHTISKVTQLDTNSIMGCAFDLKLASDLNSNNVDSNQVALDNWLNQNFGSVVEYLLGVLQIEETLKLKPNKSNSFEEKSTFELIESVILAIRNMFQYGTLGINVEQNNFEDIFNLIWEELKQANYVDVKAIRMRQFALGNRINAILIQDNANTICVPNAELAIDNQNADQDSSTENSIQRDFIEPEVIADLDLIEDSLDTDLITDSLDQENQEDLSEDSLDQEDLSEDSLDQENQDLDQNLEQAVIEVPATDPVPPVSPVPRYYENRRNFGFANPRTRHMTDANQQGVKDRHVPQFCPNQRLRDENSILAVNCLMNPNYATQKSIGEKLNFLFMEESSMAADKFREYGTQIKSVRWAVKYLAELQINMDVLTKARNRQIEINLFESLFKLSQLTHQFEIRFNQELSKITSKDPLELQVLKYDFQSKIKRRLAKALETYSSFVGITNQTNQIIDSVFNNL